MSSEKTMTTADQAVNEVFQLLRRRNVKAESGMTGNIYPYNRPLNSAGEDITISALAFNAEQEQNGVLNVNIHVPNLTQAQGAPTGDNTQPNRARFNAISGRVLEALDYYDGPTFHLTLDNAGLLVPDKEKWFMNIRVRYSTIRLDNH